jgi:hyperosmotically inducible periplasmic protein
VQRESVNVRTERKRIGQVAIAALIVAMTLSAHAQDTASAASSVSGSDTTKPATQATQATQATKAADRALQKRVVQALSTIRGLRAMGITVRARNGAVTLEGWVPEQAQIELAGKTAQGVNGVTSVDNALTLSTF